jgi:hypothetical protein
MPAQAGIHPLLVFVETPAVSSGKPLFRASRAVDLILSGVEGWQARRGNGFVLRKNVFVSQPFPLFSEISDPRQTLSVDPHLAVFCE